MNNKFKINKMDHINTPKVKKFLQICALSAGTRIARFQPRPGNYDEKTHTKIFADPIENHIVEWLYDTLPDGMSMHPVDLQFGEKIITTFKLEYTREVETKFKENIPNLSNLSNLYHGSPMYNWHSILRNGIQVMSGTKDCDNGAVHGPGVYLSDKFIFSAGYSRGFTDNKPADMVVGVYEIYDPESYRKNPSILVVPTNDLIILRYLIAVPKSLKQNDLMKLNDLIKTQLESKCANTSACDKRFLKKRIKLLKRHMKELKKQNQTLEFVGEKTLTNTQFVIMPDNIHVYIPIDYPMVESIPDINTFLP